MIVLTGHDNPQDRPWMWLVKELGVGEAEGSVYIVLHLMS